MTTLWNTLFCKRIHPYYLNYKLLGGKVQNSKEWLFFDNLFRQFDFCVKIISFHDLEIQNYQKPTGSFDRILHTYFADLWGQLKTFFWSKIRYAFVYFWGLGIWVSSTGSSLFVCRGSIDILPTLLYKAYCKRV